MEKKEYLKWTIDILRSSFFNSSKDTLVISGKLEGNIVIKKTGEYIIIYELPKNVTKKYKKVFTKFNANNTKSILFFGLQNCDITLDLTLFKITFLECNNNNIYIKKGCIHMCEFNKSCNLNIKIEKDPGIVQVLISENIKFFQLTFRVIYSVSTSKNINTSIFPNKNKKTFSLTSENKIEGYNISYISEKNGNETMFISDM